MTTIAIQPTMGRATDPNTGKLFAIYVTGIVVGDEYSLHPRFVGARYSQSVDCIVPCIVDGFEGVPPNEHDPDVTWDLKLERDDAVYRDSAQRYRRP